MKISELIKKLEDILEKNGDLRVFLGENDYARPDENIDVSVTQPFEMWAVKKSEAPFVVHVDPIKYNQQSIEEIKAICSGPHESTDEFIDYKTETPSDYYITYIRSDESIVVLE